MRNELIMIPARMGSKRFPGKALTDIDGAPMIVRVYQQCAKTDIPVTVKTPDQEIVDVCVEFGISCVITPETYCRNGSDACWEGFEWLNKEFGIQPEHIVNVQGDLPQIEPEIIEKAIACCEDAGTLLTREPGDVVAEIKRDRIVGFERRHGTPAHVGIYCYTPDALDRFYHARVGDDERETDLEGWRLIEAGLKIGYDFIGIPPVAIDYEGDLCRLAH